MKNYLKHELKANILPIIVLTVMFMALQILILQNARIDFGTWGSPPHFTIYPPSYIFFPIFVLIAASMIVPMFIFSYKNDAKTLDCVYGLPIKSQLLILTKAITAIVVVLIPWTVGYWTGVVVLAIRGAEFNYIYYLATFVIMLPISLLFVGFSSFLFTRANRSIDGAFFVLFGSFFLMLIVLPMFTYAQINWPLPLSRSAWVDPYNWTPFYGVELLFDRMEKLIVGNPIRSPIHAAEIVLPIISLILCLLAWFLLIFTATKHKAEDAGSDSTSFYGYRTMIPLSTISLALTLMFQMGGWILRGDIVNFIIIITILSMVSFIGYVWFRRSFKIKKEDLIVWGSTILAMIIAGIVILLVNHLGGSGYVFPNLLLSILP